MAQSVLRIEKLSHIIGARGSQDLRLWLLIAFKMLCETKGQLVGAGKSLKGPGARFSKLPVIIGPVRLFYFSFWIVVSKGLKTVQ